MMTTRPRPIQEPLISIPVRLTPTLIVLLGLSLLTLAGSWAPLSDGLEFRRADLAEGELWRPVTAWIAQLNLQHWLINQWGLVLLALALPPRLARADWLALGWVWLAASGALVVSAYDHYAGLSGLLYGWLVWALLRSPYYGMALRWGVVLVLSGKVLLENLASRPGVETSFVADLIQADIAVQSHAWGLVAGWLALLAWSMARRGRRQAG